MPTATTTATRASRSRTATTVNGKAAPAKAKATSQTKAVNGKRPASPENDPPAKRTKQTNAVKDKPVKAAKKETAKETAKETVAMKSEGAPKSERKPRTTGKKAAPKSDKPPVSKKTKRIVENEIPHIPEHSRPANQLFVWGAGNFGQFGLGPDQLGEFDKPRKNIWIEQKMAEGTFGGENAGLEVIAAGGMHTMFIDEKGTVWTCGVNDDAALGRLTKDVPDRNNPGTFLDVDELTATPNPLTLLIEENFRAVQVVAGDSVSAAVNDKGELRVWGSFRSNEGSLGFSSGSKYQWEPVRVLDLPAVYGEPELISSVAAGNNHLVVLTTHGNIYTLGAGQQGQLGRKILERRKIHGTTPEKVTLHIRSRKAVAVGAGNYTSFAIDNEGDVWGWGLNNFGQTGTGFESEEGDLLVQQPLLVEDLSPEKLGEDRVVSIAGGEHHTLFLTANGKVYSCGRSQQGQLGLPDGHDAMKDPKYEGMVVRPTLVPFPEEDDPVVQISAGTHNNLAVTAGGALYSWGTGNQGELGIGDDTEAKTPKMIVRREGGSWKAIAASCGGQHSLGMFRKKT